MKTYNSAWNFRERNIHFSYCYCDTQLALTSVAQRSTLLFSIAG